MGLVYERNESVEVTTDTAAKRGLAPSEEAWRGWLYNGGHAVSCTPKVCCLMTCKLLESLPRNKMNSFARHVQRLYRQNQDLERPFIKEMCESM